MSITTTGGAALEATPLKPSALPPATRAGGGRAAVGAALWDYGTEAHGLAS